MTRLAAYVAEAFTAIWRNRTRSILTMLGMIIGTASIITILGISKAASGGITGTLNSFGNPGISVNVDPTQENPQAAAIQYRDARTLVESTSSLLREVEPQYQRNLELRAGGAKITTIAVSASPLSDYAVEMAAGRHMNAADIASGARVCSISQDLATHFFGTGDPLGRGIDAGGTRCRVIGVYGPIKGGLFSSLAVKEFLVLPYTTYHEIAPGPTDGLVVYPAQGADVGRIRDAVTAELKHLHGQDAQYTVTDSTAQIAAFGSVLDVIATGLSAIGGVALIVAGIGIMNIMLVSVAERTREIGLRKAIGASRRDVMLQFLLEAILLSFMGGGTGTLIGFLVTVGAYGFVAAYVGPAPIPYLLIISVAVGFSTLVGCVFGTYPAIRAARLDPIAALRS